MEAAIQAMTAAAMTATTMATKRWDASAATAAIREVTPLARRFGFCASLFGSVACNGEGNDLDLLLWRVPHWAAADERGFLEAFGGETVAEHNRADRTTYSFEVARDGRLFHFVFQRVSPWTKK